MPVKTFIDDLIQRLFDALLASLRKAITADVTTIDSFVSEAIETLSTRPQTVEEIGEASVKHAEFAKRKKEVFVAMICVVSIVAFYRSEWIFFGESKISNIMYVLLGAAIVWIIGSKEQAVKNSSWWWCDPDIWPTS